MDSGMPAFQSQVITNDLPCHAAVKVLRGHSISKHGSFAEVRTKPVAAKAGKFVQTLVTMDIFADTGFVHICTCCAYTCLHVADV